MKTKPTTPAKRTTKPPKPTPAPAASPADPDDGFTREQRVAFRDYALGLYTGFSPYPAERAFYEPDHSDAFMRGFDDGRKLFTRAQSAERKRLLGGK